MYSFHGMMIKEKKNVCLMFAYRAHVHDSHVHKIIVKSCSAFKIVNEVKIYDICKNVYFKMEYYVKFQKYNILHTRGF